MLLLLLSLSPSVIDIVFGLGFPPFVTTNVSKSNCSFFLCVVVLLLISHFLWRFFTQNRNRLLSSNELPFVLGIENVNLFVYTFFVSLLLLLLLFFGCGMRFFILSSAAAAAVLVCRISSNVVSCSFFFICAQSNTTWLMLKYRYKLSILCILL